MANKRADPVSYRPFRVQPLLADGLADVARDHGAFDRKIAQGLANMADDFGQRAAREAAAAGERQGAIDAMNAGPGAITVTGGETTGTASANGQAGHVRGAQGGMRVRVAPAQLRTMIADAAVRHGVDPDALTQIAGIESSFNPNAKNPASSAGGLFQFVDGTARHYDLKDRFDPAQASDAAARLTRDNAGFLRSKLGREPTAGELYLAHQQGAGGALKLLANPDANAAQLVGASVVASNGGTIGMTAREFAGMWTSKLSGGGSYSKLPAVAADGPVSVVPVRTPVEITPGKPGGFQPRGGTSIYDRAYDVAGTRTYRQELELTMMQDQAAVYGAYKDDPARLEKAMGELETAHMREHVFPEIAGDYRVAFRKNAFLQIERAKDIFEKKKNAQDKVDFDGRVQTLENQKSQALAGLDPNDPLAATRLDNLQGSIDGHFDSAVARGIFTPEQAADLKRRSRSDMVVGFYTGQAKNKTSAEEIAALRAGMTRDYAAGKLEGVNDYDWERIEKGLIGAEGIKRTQDEKINTDLVKRGNDIVKRYARGLPVAPEVMTRFQLDAARTATAKGKEIAASTLVRSKVAEAIRTQPLASVEKTLSSILGEGANADDYDFARDMIASHRKDMASDPIGVAERFGILPASAGLPLTGDVDPDAVASAFSERISSAHAAARHFGVQPKYFRPGEADQIEAAVKADPQRGLAIAAGLVEAGGRDADRLLAELGETAPAVSQAGRIIADGGNATAALDLIAGYGKTPEGKNYTDVPNTKRLPIAKNIAGNALAFSPAEVNRLDTAAAAIARKRLHDAGIDPKKEDARAIYERAYQEAAGATFIGDVQFGGFGNYDPGFFWKSRKVLVPPAIRADRFGDVIQSLTDDDVGSVKAKSGKTWTAADFKKAVPVAVNGGYAFALGDPAGASPMFIADEKGNPMVLDIAAMRDRLSPRTPGAWR